MFSENCASMIRILTAAAPKAKYKYPQDASPIRKSNELSLIEWIQELCRGLKGSTARKKLKQICTDNKCDLVLCGTVEYDVKREVREFSLNAIHREGGFLNRDELVTASRGIQWMRVDFHPDSARGNPMTHPRIHIHLDGSKTIRLCADERFQNHFAHEFILTAYRCFKPTSYDEWIEDRYNETTASKKVSYEVFKQMHQDGMMELKKVKLVSLLDELNEAVSTHFSLDGMMPALSAKWP